LHLGGIRFLRARIQAGFLALFIQRGALGFRELGFREGFRGFHLAVRNHLQVLHQRFVFLRLLRGTHRGFRILDRDGGPVREIRIGLQLGKFDAGVNGSRRLGRRSRATGKERRGDGGRNQGPAFAAAELERDFLDHLLSPLLRFISSTRMLVLRFMSSFTAVAFALAVLAEASSASARDSSASCAATTIRFSVTATSAEASLVRAAPISAAA
jgi:hypothetical protein